METGPVIATALVAALGISLNALLSKIMVRYRICSSSFVAWASGAGAGCVALVAAAVFRFLPSIPALPPLLVLVLFNMLALYLLNRAIQEGDLSTVLPVMGVKIPVTAILALLLLNEQHTAEIYGAVLLSAVAVALFTAGKQETAAGGHGKHKIVPVCYALGAAGCYAFSDQFAKMAMEHIDPFTTITWTWILSGLICAALLTRHHYRQYTVQRKDAFLFVLNGALVIGAIGSLFASFQLADSVTVPNVVFATRGFFALAMGFTLNRFLRVPMEQQPAHIYVLRGLAALLLFTSIALVVI